MINRSDFYNRESIEYDLSQIIKHDFLGLVELIAFNFENTFEKKQALFLLVEALKMLQDCEVRHDSI